MPAEPERRLAAILSADVAGYSRLMADDEAATVRTLTAYRDEIARLVGQHVGRVVDNPGDNVLCEFAAATHALACALEIQRVLGDRNAGLAPERRMVFRIGVHIGEVLAEGPRIYGDGVNIAARLEGLAEPGSVCVSHALREQVGTKLPVAFDDLGVRSVKNIPGPVRVYRARDADAKTPVTAVPAPRPSFVGLAVALVAVVAIALWLTLGERDATSAPAAREPGSPVDALGSEPRRALGEASAPGGDASVGGAAAPANSVAVLPFLALSAGVDDGYFADGLTEEIINALATLPDLLVTARTSAFYFKNKDVPIREIAATLGVSHVVEGSVRRAGDKVRISAQLIRAPDGFHLWSETYDRSLDDVFAVQRQIAESVAGALGVLLDERERAAMANVGVRDVAAFIAYQRGVELFNRAHNEGPMLPLLARANAEFEVAIARKPDFAHAHFQHADYYAHMLIDEAPGHGPGFVSEAGVSVGEAARRLSADLAAAQRYERDAAQRRVIQALRTTVSADWAGLEEQIVRAFAGLDNCRHGLWIDQTAVVFGHGEAALEHDLRRIRCDPLGGDWNRMAITAVWVGRPKDGVAYADRLEALRGQDRDVLHGRILAYLALGRLDEAAKLFDAGNFGAADVSKAMSLLTLQIPAAAGRAAEWQRLRPSLAHDPGRLLVGAAVFGDRASANRAAAEIDAMTLGPTILLRAVDRCGCGVPFDLDATPIFARRLREANLPWSPPAPIEFPLKTW